MTEYTKNKNGGLRGKTKSRPVSPIPGGWADRAGGICFAAGGGLEQQLP